MTVNLNTPNQVLVDMPDTFTISKEVEASINRRLRKLMGKPFLDRLKRDHLDKPMTAETLRTVQEKLDVRWRQLIVEYDTLFQVNSDLMPHGIGLTGMAAREDPDCPTHLVIVPIIKELV